MSAATSFEELDAWQASRRLTKKIYQATGTGEFSRDFGLKDQIRRASVSVMENIAEGFDRNHDPDFKVFLRYAKGSSAEVKAQLYVGLDAGFLSDREFRELYRIVDTVSPMLSGLISYLRDG